MSLNITESPTLIGTVAGISFYEHPTYGDEHPLIYKRGGEWLSSDWYELPTHSEAEELTT